MPSLFLTVVLLAQDLSLQPSKPWEALARPWMTREETALFDSLSESEKEKFKGYFVARRLEDASHWPETGLFLPYFFPKTDHGDVRDRILQILGPPPQRRPNPLTPELPLLWKYGSREFGFEPAGEGKVALDGESEARWEEVKRSLIRHPLLRYDFHVQSFGRTRFPTDLTWVPTAVEGYWLAPEPNGARIQISIPIPEQFKSLVTASRAAPVQAMEMLVLLKRPGDTSAEPGIDGTHMRHGSRRFNLIEASRMHFETYLPPGHYQADFYVYSGFLQNGLKASTSLRVLPPELPRIGDPVPCTQWREAGIAAPEPGVLAIGEEFYSPAMTLPRSAAARVLVNSAYPDTRLLLQTGDGVPVSLDLVTRHGDWFVFQLPPQEKVYRLLAVGYPERGNTLALSGSGPGFGSAASLPFRQQSSDNYLNLEQLEFGVPAGESFLFVNGFPVLGSKSGGFPWPPMDWGRTAAIRVEYRDGNAWRAASFSLPRHNVFEEIRVKPKYIVAATQGIDGQVEPVDIEVSVVGQPVEVVQRSSLLSVPKLFGIVVNDPLLKSPAWPLIRQTLTHWLKKYVHAGDLVYLVHNAHRPVMFLEPTTLKPLVQAGLEALAPTTRDENYFTVQYLIDALTHLKYHQTRPHQVLLLTNQLTDEIQQMEDLLPRLRQTGLQIYNLEFPFEFVPESEEKVADRKPDALDKMAAREEEEQRERFGIRDNFQETRNVTTGFRWVFKTKQAKAKEREEQIRREAFHDAFNTQLAGLTAGLAHTSGFGETVQSLRGFFEKYGRWLETMVHLELSLPYLEEDLIKLETPNGYSASWTLVEWRAPDGN